LNIKGLAKSASPGHSVDVRWVCLPLLVPCLLLAGCDKTRGWLGMDEVAVGSGAATPGGEVDEELAAMVERGEEGVRFRRDLPFPARLRVALVERTRFHEVRVLEENAFGRTTRTIDFGIESRLEYGKSPGGFELKVEKFGRWLPEVLEGEAEASAGEEPAGGGEEALAGSDLVDRTVRFSLTEDGWKTLRGSGDFKAAVIGASLEEVVPQVMVEAGVHPRVQWFSSSRGWRPGDRIVLTGNALKILDPHDVSGRVSLNFVGEEAIGGHPCGVFEVAGDFEVRDRVQADGTRLDLEVAVDTGRIWASLLHPVLLREEYDTVQTRVQRGEGGVARREQGRIEVTRARHWVPVEG